MNADPIEEIRKTLVLLRQNFTTKKRFPSETHIEHFLLEQYRQHVRAGSKSKP